MHKGPSQPPQQETMEVDQGAVDTDDGPWTTVPPGKGAKPRNPTLWEKALNYAVNLPTMKGGEEP